MPDLDILFHDDHIVVVNKPSGTLSVPGRGPEKYDSIASRVKEHFAGCIDQPATHRLDMDTSGILVLALTAEAHRHLSIQFQNRETRKRYIALLDGQLPDAPASGIIELPFRLDIDNRPHQIYDEVHGKMGITHWQILGQEGSYTRIEFKPITGRTHQLRVHAAHEKGLGTPIV
ncbi:MAG: RluA family pseudouridine synthase, partial [Verrucomicrobiota bacterium]